MRCLVVLSAGLGYAPQPVAVPSPLERAVVLAREKKYGQAQELLKGVPEPAAIAQRIAFHRLKASIAAGLGDGAAAAHEMEAALVLAPADTGLLAATAMAKALAGDSEERKGRFEQSIQAYRDAVALAPSVEAYRIALALELIRHQTFEPAIALLRESTPLFPSSARLRTLLGIALYAKSDVEEAIAALLDALEADPRSEPAHRCLAQIVLQSSAAPLPAVVERLCPWNSMVCSALQLRVARANDDLKMQSAAMDRLKTAPQNDTMARCELARAYEWSDQMQNARREMEACVRADSSPQNHYRMGLIYRRLGLEQMARQEMQLRSKILEKMTEDTAAGLNTLKSFQ